MSVYINKDTKVIVQGMTGSQGKIQSEYMLKYGTNVVAGVTPGKGGQTVLEKPIYSSVSDALKEHQADWSCLFVPARFIKAAAFEALEAGLNIIIVTEGIPVYDTLDILKKAKELGKIVLGPNCPGITTVNESKIGIMPNNIFTKKGPIGLVSRSGTLTYEIAHVLNEADLGQSTIVGIGGDPTPGTSFIDAVNEFEKDDETKVIVVVGEIGGTMEEETAEYIKKNIKKPVVAYIVGITAPAEKQMGHAGAIVSKSSGTAKAKIEVFEKLGIPVVDMPEKLPEIIKQFI